MADTTKIYENIFIKKNAAGDREYIKVPYAILADPPSIPNVVQDGGESTANVMSQKAVSDALTGISQGVVNALQSLAPQENGKLNKKVYVYPDGSLASGTSYDASKDLYLSIGDGLTLETIDEANNIWNIKTNAAIDSVDGLLGGTISGNLQTTGNMQVDQNLTVSGNLTVNGTTTTVDSTTLQVKDKLIEVAHGNTTKLTTPAGLVAPKYDGTNSGALVFDGDGTAYVGDVTLDSAGNIDVSKSELQPLATRTGLVGGNLVQYDSTAQTLKDSGKKISDLATTSQVNAKYTKPSGGIPKTDLASSVQTSLGKADTALQSAPVTSVNGKTGAVTIDVPSAVTSINGLSGGTLTSPITLTGGDSTTASKMILDTNGQITDTGTATLFGRSSGNLIVGSGSYPTTFRGKQTRPTYNGNDMALKSDIPDVSDKANLSGGNVFQGKQEFLEDFILTSDVNSINPHRVFSDSNDMLAYLQNPSDTYKYTSQTVSAFIVNTDSDNRTEIVDGRIDNKKSGTIYRLTLPQKKGTLAITSDIPDISGKQDKLTAGSNITISGNTISATVPKDVVKYTAQTLTTAQKTQARSNIGAGTSSFSGSYNDLTNKPTIPTVNNGTLTIQKNGTTVATFSANQSGNSTANITVPTFSLSGTTLTITL